MITDLSQLTERSTLSTFKPLHMIALDQGICKLFKSHHDVSNLGEQILNKPFKLEIIGMFVLETSTSKRIASVLKRTKIVLIKWASS